ncbi:MAG TPA: hypothetical protein VHY83_11380 [Solirubrobacteraceae bacterium]|jgi:hypothetical protein|nr:hypothetical protein [Solirubrobacteraceae bacterium]
MTEGERRAFVDGFVAGSEAQVRAHDPLLGTVIACMWAIGVLADGEGLDVATGLEHYDAQVFAVMADVERVRFDFEAALEAALELQRIERAAEAAEGVER